MIGPVVERRTYFCPMSRTSVAMPIPRGSFDVVHTKFSTVYSNRFAMAKFTSIGGHRACKPHFDACCTRKRAGSHQRECEVPSGHQFDRDELLESGTAIPEYLQNLGRHEIDTDRLVDASGDGLQHGRTSVPAT